MRRIILLLSASMLTIVPAQAQDGQAWNDWVYRANSILHAIESGEQSQVDVACGRIVREMMARPSLPLWAREVVGTCSALREGLSRGRKGSFCRQARDNAKALRKAAPVDEEPRAYPLAIRLAEAMDGLHQGLCK